MIITQLHNHSQTLFTPLLQLRSNSKHRNWKGEFEIPDRTIITPIRLTAPEYQRLAEQCRKSGLSVSQVVRSALAGLELRERPPDDLGRLYTEINRIGNNINQIARKLNAGLGTRSDVQKALFLLRQVYRQLERVADR